PETRAELCCEYVSSCPRPDEGQAVAGVGVIIGDAGPLKSLETIQHVLARGGVLGFGQLEEPGRPDRTIAADRLGLRAPAFAGQVPAALGDRSRRDEPDETAAVDRVAGRVDAKGLPSLGRVP